MGDVRGVTVAAVDLGASSGRVMLADVGRDVLDLRPTARFANEPVRLPSGLHWNVAELYRQALTGLRAAVRQAPRQVASVAVDSWAVDYGIVRDERLYGLPFHYRDTRNTEAVRRVHARVPFEELYARNGLQMLEFNTLYQLASETDLREGDEFLLVPDLVTYWLTGRRLTERTNASTTGLLGADTREWDRALMDRLGLPASLAVPLVEPGTVVGEVSADVGDVIGAPGLAVTAVASHDTASAVVGAPLMGADAAYLSLGTWGLVGLELDASILTAAAREANFTNEGGVDGTTRFLTNVMGTWLLSQTVHTWERDGRTRDLGDLLAAAADVPPADVTLFDVQDPVFAPPGDMPARIRAWCREHGERFPEGEAAMVRSIIESLAAAYAHALQVAEQLSGRPIGTVHVVGGGSQNTLLCQAVANRSGRHVVAGPVEATTLGNVLIQARALGAIAGDLSVLRELVARTQDLRHHDPT